MKRLLVTGRHGFVGGRLAHLVAVESPEWRLMEVPVSLDIRDPGAIHAVLGEAPPDAVIHLAAQSSVQDAFRDPAATLQVNLLGTLNLLQALQRCGFRGRMVYVSSGDVYGMVPENALPIDERRLPAPRNPYAVSKLAAEALCHQWSVTEDLDVVIARPFNHIGAGQDVRFATSDFARQIAEIKLGRRPPVVDTGDIDVTRDFTDVDDVVRAYFALLARGAKGEVYNVCSGREVSIRHVLEMLAELAGVDVTVRQDATRLRRAEQRRVRGDSGKLRGATGWQATTPIEASLSALLQHWESEIRNG